MTTSKQTIIGLEIKNKENTSNKVTTLSANSTDAQYPSARCVYSKINSLEQNIITLINGTG